MYRDVKRLYGKRSELIHRGETKIIQADVIFAESIFRSLTIRLLELSKKYDKFESKDPNKPADKEGLNDYIENRLFGESYRNHLSS